MNEDIRVLTHSSIRIQDDDRVIYVDPYQVKEEAHDADFIFVTHDHFDHFSPEDIAKVAGSHTILVMPENMAEKARAVGAPEGGAAEMQIFSVAPGECYETEGLAFETVPAYNKLKPFHPKKAGWVGYVIQACGQRIYIAGDTDATKEAAQVQCDTALVPAGGKFTMNAKEAAALVNEMAPALAIPTHYGSVAGRKSDGEKFVSLVKAPVKAEIRMEY